ncbi:MAG: ISAs1 family transposase [Flavobacteriales bacterium]|nr:ISAs1 family transposase [Flavobacteriales bacterium]
MKVETTKDPLGCFSVFKDPRINRTKLYNLEAIIFQTVSTIISGCDSWTEIELFGETKKEWLEDYVHIPNGTPSHDTLSDLFKRINPLAFEECFRNRTTLISDIADADLIVFDGKRIRGVMTNTRIKNLVGLPRGSLLLEFRICK